MQFHEWLKTAWTNLLSWFGVTEQKIASLFYPVFLDAGQLVKKDVLADIIGGLPVVEAALPGGLAAAITAAEAYVLPILAKQGIELAQTTLNTLYNALVAQAHASVASTASTGTPAPAEGATSA